MTSLSMPVTGKCSKLVYRSRDLWRSYPCEKQAKVVVDGKEYCTIHDPNYVQGKKAEQHARWDAKWAADAQARRDQEEQARRAECFPDLVAALERIVAEMSTEPDPED